MKSMRGASLVELLTGTAVLAVLLASAAPTFRDLRERSARAAVNNELIASLSLARSEALRSRLPTVVCPALDDASGCRADGAWQHGWIAFVDANRDNQPGGPGDRLLEVHGPLPGATLVSGSTRPRVRYAPNGLNTGSNLSIRLCQSGKVVSAVVVNNVGRPRIELKERALAGWDCRS